MRVEITTAVANALSGAGLIACNVTDPGGGNNLTGVNITDSNATLGDGNATTNQTVANATESNFTTGSAVTGGSCDSTTLSVNCLTEGAGF